MPKIITEKKGIGRPTKKDRRDIDGYQEETTEEI